MPEPKKKNSGFTLVELVVTIAVVGVLALMVTSVLVLVSNDSKRQGVRAAAASELAEIKSSVVAFLTRYDAYTYKLAAAGGQAAFTYGAETNSLTFDEKTRSLIINENGASEQTKYSRIVRLSFTVRQDSGGCLVVCVIDFEGGAETVVHFLKAANLFKAEKLCIISF